MQVEDSSDQDNYSWGYGTTGK